MSFSLCAQQSYNLEYFLAKSINSSDYSIINKQAEIYNMEHQLFNKNFLPDFNLNITLPSYNRSIREVLQPDGNYAFRESNNASSRANLSVTQKIPYTGGSVSITNSFSRLDFFGDTQNTTTYAASWLGVNLTQPLNPLLKVS